MTIDPQAAADALRSIEETETRARTAERYRIASSSFLIWGVAWFVANLLCEFIPERTGTIWLTIDTLAIASSIAASWRSGADWRSSVQWLSAFSAMALLILCLFSILPPRSMEQITVVISLLVAFTLTLAGVFSFGVRFVVLGLILTALLAGGYFWLPSYHFLWFGIVCGGALVLAGVWMRKA